MKKEIKPEIVSRPINVAMPNTTHQKMEAIVNASIAVRELAKALNGVNTQVTISHNYVENRSEQPAIFITNEAN